MARPSPPSPLDATVMEPVTEVARTLWPGIAVIPEMSTGATDGLFVRNAGIPVYGVSAIAEDPDDVRAHGQDERIRVDSYVRATEYWYRLIKAFSGS
jgi:acetylornithine deacetylase/succinyl-diaminopimelate desuccinylase-like protein